MNDQEAFAIAVEDAKIGYKEGGVPVSLQDSSLSFVSQWNMNAA
jgi:hypothetical protein